MRCLRLVQGTEEYSEQEAAIMRVLALETFCDACETAKAERAFRAAGEM